LGALAAVLSVGSVASVYAAAEDQAVTEKSEHHRGALKGGCFGLKGFKGEGKPFVKGTPFEDNTELLALLKIDAAKLKEEWKAGKSLAEIAAAQGVSAEAVIELLTKQHEAKLAEAVKAGKLTQEQADKLKEKTAERVKAFVENPHVGRGHGFGGKWHLKDNAELLALLKIDAEKLKEEWKAGKSLAEIAAAQGVSTEAVIELLTKQHEAKLAEAVKAGKLTQEQAEKFKANWENRVKQMVERKFSGSRKSDKESHS
jgi:DNA-binding CsgD family transcriptional regulator